MDKTFWEENKSEFVSVDIEKEGLNQMLRNSRAEMVDKVHTLYEKKYNTLRELADKKRDLLKIEESLKKTDEKLKKVREGDLTVLFEKAE